MQLHWNRVPILLGLLGFVQIISVVPATAGPVTNLPTINFAPGTNSTQGNLSGFFSLDSGGALSDWSIHVTSQTGIDNNNSPVTFPDFIYTSANSTGTLFTSVTGLGVPLSEVDFRENGYPGGTTGGKHDMLLAFQRIPPAIPPGGIALQLCTAAQPCDQGGGIFTVSNEFFTTAGTGFGTRNLVAGYLTISDPPGSISLNLSAEPRLFPVNPQPVPEPTTLLLVVGSGLAGILGARRRKPLLRIQPLLGAHR